MKILQEKMTKEIAMHIDKNMLGLNSVSITLPERPGPFQSNALFGTRLYAN
jgi:hypothetical protein